MGYDQLPRLQFTEMYSMPVVIQPLGSDGAPEWAIEEARNLGGDEDREIPGRVLAWAIYSGNSGGHVGYILRHRGIYWPLYFSTEWNDYCLAHEARRFMHALNYLTAQWRGIQRRERTWMREVNRVAREHDYLNEAIRDLERQLREARYKAEHATEAATRRFYGDRATGLERDLNDVRAERAQLEEEPPPPRAGRPLGLNRIWFEWEGTPGGRITGDGPAHKLRPTLG